MDGWSIAFIGYGVIAGFSLYASLREARSRTEPPAKLWWRLAGVVLCLLWPMAVVVLVCAILRERRSQPVTKGPTKMAYDPMLAAVGDP